MFKEKTSGKIDVMENIDSVLKCLVLASRSFIVCV